MAADYKLLTFQTEENNKKPFCVSGDVLTYMQDFILLQVEQIFLNQSLEITFEAGGILPLLDREEQL